jgi:zinc transporter ZupT
MTAISENAGEIIGYAFIPGGFLLLGSLISAFVVVLPPKVIYAMQHFAGGIILSAIAMEFIPIIANSGSGFAEIAVMTAGFLGGASSLIAIDKLTSNIEEKLKEHNVSSSDSDKDLNPMRNIELPLIICDEESGAVQKKSANSTRKSMVSRAFEQIKLTTAQGEQLAPILRSTLLLQEEKDNAQAKRKYPAAFALSLCIDVFFDGMYIGIGYITSKLAGNPYGALLLAFSLSFDNTCLGLAFAIAVPQKSSIPVKIFSFLMGPTVLMCSTFLGSSAGAILERSELGMLAISSFGTSALLYTVGKELLVTAKEDIKLDWWIELTTIYGFLFTMIVGKIFENFS